MRKVNIALIFLALSTAIPPDGYSLEIPLKFEKASARSQKEFFPFGRGECQFTGTLPPGNWKLPALLSHKPLYGIIPLGDRNHLLALDTGAAKGEQYSRLWFDRDGDGDLAEEQPADGKVNERKGGNSYAIAFPEIDATVQDGDVSFPYCMRPSLSGSRTGGPRPVTRVRFVYSVSCIYSGMFSIGGKQYRIQLSDTNGNGRFTDPVRLMDYHPPLDQYPVYAEGDFFYLADLKVTGSHDACPTGDFLWIGDTPRELKIDLAAGKAMLTEVRTGLSPVKLGMGTERLLLYTEDGERFVTVFKPSSENITLPPGQYKLLFYQAFRKDSQGDLWRLRANGTNKSPAVAVAPGGNPVLEFGEPFTMLVTPVPPNRVSSGRKDTRISLRLDIEGSGGEFLNDLTRIEGSRTRIRLSEKKGRENRPHEPSYTIAKPDGEIVSRGSFEYG